VDYGLEHKVAVISGGSRGIGLATAREFIKSGASVAIAGHTEANVGAAVKELQELAYDLGNGAKAIGVVVDLGQAEGVKQFAGQAIEEFGGADILVNNVGDSGYGPLLDLKDETIIDAWSLKALGAIRLTRALLPSMQARGWGSIVNISGGAGRSPSPDAIPAAIANSSVRVFTKAMAGDFAKQGIAINCITPGSVATDRHMNRAHQRSQATGASIEQILQEQDASSPTGHVTTPEEVAELILFLASRRVYNLTGAEITLDGGTTRFL
jgi:NAD(P)-dependent dehydrogenase (short-subunit alcohol dehydrogenase family)